MSRNLPVDIARAATAALLLAACAGHAIARSSDRNQEMVIDSGSTDGSFADNGTTVLQGNVVITQGTLDIRAARGEIFMKNGEVSRAVFTGKQAQLKQVNDDGTPVTATADRLEYDVLNDIITLTGNYKVTSPKGSNSGQKMVYNTKTGSMQSGGDGTRVRTVIQPKNKAAAPPSGATK